MPKISYARSGLHLAAQPTSGGNVAMIGVIHHHSMRAKSPSQGADRIHHSTDPFIRQPIVVAVVKSRNDGRLERFVERLGVTLIGNSFIDMLRALADSESI